jgi:hypothetical protein
MKHVLYKTGIGVGLMATSLGAMATGANLGLHTFAESSVFAKTSGGNPIYATFIPSGNASTDSVILVELTQGTGTAPGTWQYYVSSGSLGAANNVAGEIYSYSIEGSDTQSAWGITNTSITSGYGNLSFYGAVGNFTTESGSSASANAKSSNGENLLQFSYSTAVSSQTCSISFNAYVGTDDYLQYQVIGVNTAGSSLGWNSILGASSTAIAAANSYAITTKSGGAATDTVSGTNFGADFAGNVALYGTSTASVPPTFSYAIVNLHNGPAAAPTLTGTGATGAGVFKQMNTCYGVVNNRIALNSSGLVVGGKVGLIRIW